MEIFSAVLQLAAQSWNKQCTNIIPDPYSPGPSSCIASASMGPVDILHIEAGKLFASFYALYSGVAFLVTAGILVVPIAHRMLHRLHLAQDED